MRVPLTSCLQQHETSQHRISPATTQLPVRSTQNRQQLPHAAPTRAKGQPRLLYGQHHISYSMSLQLQLHHICIQRVCCCFQYSKAHIIMQPEPYFLATHALNPFAFNLTYQADSETSQSYIIKLLQQACTVANFSHHHPDHSSSYADCQQGSYSALHVPNGCILW